MISKFLTVLKSDGDKIEAVTKRYSGNSPILNTGLEKLRMDIKKVVDDANAARKKSVSLLSP